VAWLRKVALEPKTVSGPEQKVGFLKSILENFKKLRVGGLFGPASKGFGHRSSARSQLVLILLRLCMSTNI